MIEPGRLARANNLIFPQVPSADSPPAPPGEVCTADHGHGDESQTDPTREPAQEPARQLTRDYAELLQEVRVAQTGVQFLLVFLLGCAFTPRFAELTPFQRSLFVLALLLIAATSGLLIAPAAYHRVLFRRGLKDHIVEAANRYATIGLITLVCALMTALLLVLDMVAGHFPAAVLTGASVMHFIAWWYVVPMTKRIRHRATSPRHSIQTRHSTET